MKNSLLQDESYSTLIKLRKHFEKAINNIPGGENKYTTDDYKKLKSFVDDINEIIIEKYISDTNSFFNYNPQN